MKDCTEAYSEFRAAQINREFEQNTKLKKEDYDFFRVALALQCVRKYVLEPCLKKECIDASVSEERDEKENAEVGWYHVASDKILTNRVPFDVQRCGTHSSIQGFLKGDDDRSMILGHDPIFGWVFGTANILTGTVTRRDFASAHVKCSDNTNEVYALADTGAIFAKMVKRVSQKGYKGRFALSAAIVREYMCLKSDVNTEKGIPIPGIGPISPDLRNQLSRYASELSHSCVANLAEKKVTISSLIDDIIGVVYRLYLDETKDTGHDYMIRKDWIILWSSFIVSESNMIASILTKYDEMHDMEGLLAAIVRLMTDECFVLKVKEELLRSDQLHRLQERVNSVVEAAFKGK